MSSPLRQSEGDPGNNPNPANQKGTTIGTPTGDDPRDTPVKPAKQS